MMTDRLVKWIGQQALKRTFTSLADETGVVEGTIRNIFRDYINELERRQVMLDENSETILKQIGGGQPSLGVREAARRLAEHGDIEKFTRERHEARAAQQLTQALHVKPK